MDRAETAAYGDTRDGLRPAWIQLGLLFVTALLAYTDRKVLSLFVAPVQHDLHLDDVQSGLLIGTAFGCIYAVTGLPMGWLVDRTSRRALLAAGAAVWTAGTVGCGLSSSFLSLFLSRIVVGVGESVLSPAAVSMIGDLFSPRLQARALSVYFMGIEAGAGVSLVAGGSLIGVAHAVLPIAPWRGVFMLLGVLGLLLVGALLAWLREPRRVAPHLPRAAGGAWRDVRSVAAVFGAVALMSLLENAIAAWAPTLLIRGVHMGMATAGLSLGPCLIAGGSLGVLAGGWCADRAAASGGWPRKLTLLWPACFAYAAISFALLGTDVRLLLGAVTVLFFLSGFVTAVGLSTIVDLVPPRRRGIATAASFFLNVMLGVGLGPVLTALLARAFGGAHLDWSLICIAAATMLPIGLALLACAATAARKTV